MAIEERILEELLSGSLAPGSKIKVSELKERYQVSLSPLREALSRLLATGLLQLESNKGYTVTDISVQEQCDLYEAAAVTEDLALKQALERRDQTLGYEDEIVASLYQLEKMERAPEAPAFADWLRANQRFHDSLVNGCSPITQELRSLLHPRAERYIRLAYQAERLRLEIYHKEHAEIAQAVLDFRNEEARRLLKAHIMDARAMIMAQLDRS